MGDGAQRGSGGRRGRPDSNSGGRTGGGPSRRGGGGGKPGGKGGSGGRPRGRDGASDERGSGSSRQGGRPGGPPRRDGGGGRPGGKPRFRSGGGRPSGGRPGQGERRPRGDEPSQDRTPKGARSLAAMALHRVEAEGVFISQVRAEADRDPKVDRAFTDYLSGVTRWKRLLDHLIAGAYHGDFGAMESILKQILRIGAYELHIRKRAAHAAVHEGVGAATRLVSKGAGGLTNAVLRAVANADPDASVASIESVTERLGVRWSHPDWLVERFVQQFGEQEAVALMRLNNEAPHFGLRITGPAAARAAFGSMLSDIGLEYEASPYLDNFVRVQRLQPLIRARWLERGYCAVHDESTGLVVRLLDPKPGEHVVDACAAPGGKSLYIADQLSGKGAVTAIEVAAARLDTLKDTASRAATPVEVVHGDFVQWANENEAVADRVLVDAPCSGLGVLGRRADLRWQRGAQQFEELAALQDRLLDAAARVVRPGGVLVYATCTIAREENEDRVHAFLERHPDFEIEPAKKWLPESVLQDEGFLATLPQRHGVDGAFAARLRRRPGETT